MEICQTACDWPEAALASPGTIPSSPGSSAVSTVLVVDDSYTDRTLVGSLLREIPKLQVEFASNGQEALERIRRSPPDLIISDQQMPDMEGAELAAIVGRQFPLIPVVLMAGVDGTAVPAAKATPRGYVPKTALSRVLPGTVERLLSLSRQRREQTHLLDCLVATETTFVLTDNDPTVITQLVEYAAACMRNARICPPGGENLLTVPLEEALRNAIMHGNLEIGSALHEVTDGEQYAALIEERRQQPPYCERQVRVTISVSSQAVKYVVRDEGHGFDLAQVPDPTDPAHLYCLSGRGLLLMKSLMDEMIFNEQGNEVTLIKRVNPERPAAEGMPVV